MRTMMGLKLSLLDKSGIWQVLEVSCERALNFANGLKISSASTTIAAADDMLAELVVVEESVREIM